MFVAILFDPGAAVRGRADIVFVPAIRRPLPGIAQHAVKPERIGRESCRHRRARWLSQWLPQPLQLALLAADSVAPPARRRGAGARGIFPFRFARQAIGPRYGASSGRSLRTWRSATRCRRRRRANPGRQPAIAAAPLVLADRRAVAGRTPSHVENRIAGCGLIAGVSEKDQELLARDVDICRARTPSRDTSAAVLRYRNGRLSPAGLPMTKRPAGMPTITGQSLHSWNSRSLCSWACPAPEAMSASIISKADKKPLWIRNTGSQALIDCFDQSAIAWILPARSHVVGNVAERHPRFGIAKSQ